MSQFVVSVARAHIAIAQTADVLPQKPFSENVSRRESSDEITEQYRK